MKINRSQLTMNHLYLQIKAYPKNCVSVQKEVKYGHGTQESSKRKRLIDQMLDSIDFRGLTQDVIALGFKIPDRKLTHSGAPTARQVPVIVKRGQGSLTLRFETVEGDPADHANKSHRLYYKVVVRGEAPPSTPEELTKNVPANRINETLRFEYGDSGKTVYNGGTA